MPGMRAFAVILSAAILSACLPLAETGEPPSPTSTNPAAVADTPEPPAPQSATPATLTDTASASTESASATPSLTPSTTALTSLPDLVVTYVFVEMDTRFGVGGCAISYTPLGVGVIVGNVGPSDAGPFVIDLNGTQQAVQAGLAASHSLKVHFPGTAAGGAYAATVDVANQVVESNEGNNSALVLVGTPTPPRLCTVTPGGTPTPTRTPPGNAGLPDLVISSMEPRWSCYSASQPLSVRVWIENIGNAPAGPFVVTMTDVQRATITAGLAAGEKVSWWFDGPPAYGQAYIALADADEQVAEGNEDNNQGIMGIPPNCTATPATASTPSPTPTRTPIPSGGPTLTATPPAGG